MNKDILIINTGGTFNKQYNQLNGSLVIKKSNDLVKSILQKSKIENIEVEGIIYKDSLELTDDDRTLLAQYIQKVKYKKIVIIHGTDTMDQTAQFLNDTITDKQIVLTGAMVPYSITKVEAVSNMMMGYGYLLSNTQNGIFISMHGMVENYKKIKKNRVLGLFECQ